MQMKISYFYQVRNFKPYQIPVSTAMWDPLWYHNRDKEQKTVFRDKNKVYNGLRFPKLSPRTIYKNNKCNGQAGVGTLCNGNSNSCNFLRAYREYLDSLDFNDIYNQLKDLAEKLKVKDGFEEEPEIILLVHETPTNPCSERKCLVEWFESHNVSCKEF